MEAAHRILDWMLATDPALAWQVERDLLDAPEERWRATRARVATDGVGARLLAVQDADGQWAGGSFFPAGFDFEGPEAAPGAGQPWTATSWSLKALREWGLDARVLGDTAERLAAASRWDYNGEPYWQGEVDVCINAATLAAGGWLGADVAALARWFPEHRLADGGWNCEWVEGATVSSVHSTLNAVKGLLDYEIATGGDDDLRAARHAGEEYLLERHLLRRLSTGEPIADWTTQFVYPIRWRFSALAALDHFRAASLHDGTPPDARLADAVAIVRAARQPDGTWLQHDREKGRVWFDIDVPPGEPSPWLTMIALRVLRWWDDARPNPAKTVLADGWRSHAAD
ncbi:squalene cyclase [Galbitalea sp. SE-J8]|uniref:squalene cyclase n=1 Tax=Galbitalea sp. SE-J8 TaxID=3054952 RepID=UPI00259D30E8|nr:squalene cyclase [Galbitalea sp. SE-J8]MDM4761727.1 squalene cyclase [Galbitalea sp. SE-J8]